MNKNQDLQVYLDLARRLRYQENFIEKRKLVHSRIPKLSPSGADESYSMIGKVLYSSEEFEKSLFPLKKAIIINPKNTFAQTCLANSFLKLGKDNECFFTIQKALSIYPRETALHSLIINIHKERKQLQDLLSFYQKTSAMIKDERYIVELYFHSAEILERSKMIPQALELYKKATETNRMRIDQQTRYAEILHREGFFEEAIVQFEHLCKLKPNNPFAINSIAPLHYELGRVEKALEILEEIIKKGLPTIMTYPNLILVLSHLGKDEEAVKIFQDSLQRFPQREKEQIQKSYKTELKRAEEKLASDIDENSREFYTKKLKAFNMVLSLINIPQE